MFVARIGSPSCRRTPVPAHQLSSLALSCAAVSSSVPRLILRIPAPDRAPSTLAIHPHVSVSVPLRCFAIVSPTATGTGTASRSEARAQQPQAEEDPVGAEAFARKQAAYEQLKSTEANRADALTKAIALFDEALEIGARAAKNSSSWQEAAVLDAMFGRTEPMLLEKAIALLEEAGAAKNSSSWLEADVADALLGKATALIQLKKPDAALPLLDRALELDPTLVPVYHKRGECHHALAAYPDAVYEYTQFYDNFDQYYRGSAALAAASAAPQTLPDAQRAEAFLEEILCDVLFKRGVCYYHIRDYDIAITDFEAVIAHESSYSARALHWRGKCLMVKNEWWRAIDDNTAALRLSPRYAPAYHDRAVAYECVGEKALAAADRRNHDYLLRELLVTRRQ